MSTHRNLATMRKMQPGTFGGQSRSATPVSPIVLPQGLVVPVPSAPEPAITCSTLGWSIVYADGSFTVFTEWVSNDLDLAHLGDFDISIGGILPGSYTVTIVNDGSDEIFDWYLTDDSNSHSFLSGVAAGGGTETASALSLDGSNVLFSATSNPNAAGTLEICLEP